MKILLTVGLAALASTPALVAQDCTASSSSQSAVSNASWDGGDGSGAQRSDKRDIVETAVAAGSFKTLVAALEAAGLVDALEGDGPFTVFAPTDAAFAALPKGTVEGLLKRDAKADLTRVLTFHVVPGRVPASAVVKLDTADTLSGQRLAIAVDDGGVSVNGARVVQTDIECSNGIIHVIDAVLLPETRDIVAIAAADERFSTLVAAVQAAGLVEALQGDGPLTVFAPTNAAFAALPEGTLAALLRPEGKAKLTSILTFHVVAGRVFAEQALEAGQLTTLQGGELDVSVDNGHARVQSAGLVVTDIQTSNGVIHVIDGVLLPE